MLGNKKKMVDDSDDEDTVDGDRRMEGMHAAVFSQPIGFTPTFPSPPKYIKVSILFVLQSKWVSDGAV